MSAPVRFTRQDRVVAAFVIFVLVVAGGLGDYSHSVSNKFDRFCHTAIQTNVSLNALIANNIHRIQVSTVLTPAQKADQLDSIHRIPKFGPVEC